MGSWKDFRLLMWKIILLQKRRPLSTLLELFLPALFILILVVLRLFSDKHTLHAKYVWPAFKLTNKLPDIKDIIEKSHGPWKLAYSPNTSYFNNLVKKIPNYININGTVGFSNERHLIDTVLTDEENYISNQTYLCGIIFDSKPEDETVRYRVRFPASPRSDVRKFTFLPKKWYTQLVYPFTMEGHGPRRNNSDKGGRPCYYEEGFLSIQRAIDLSILSTKSPSFNADDIDISMRRFPYPSRIMDEFLVVIQTMLPLLLMASLIYSALVIVKNIVYEKENKLKEAMIMMGLKGWLHWLSWFTKCFAFLFVSMIMITFLLCTRFGENSGKMLEASDPTLIFVFLLMYSLSGIMFCFFVSTFFYRASLSAAGSGIIWFLMYSPYFVLFEYLDKMDKSTFMLSSLDFNIAMAYGANLIGRFEGQGSGVQWSNMYKGVTVDDEFMFGHVLLMFGIDAIFYGMLTWYIDGVFPGEYGIPKKWYFPFMRKYWCGIQEKVNGSKGHTNKVMFNEEIYLEKKNASEFIEKEPEGLKPGIKVMNLVKQFKADSGIKVAVNKVSLNLYEGEITALLGHNGAGKTTTIAMLTGLFPPTSGNAIVNGYDILYNINGVRKSLGICPQHNILFDLLTVEEHLWFFTNLKGIMSDELIEGEVERMIGLIGLEEKRHVQSKHLSGGMKRKLSVGIALVGGSKVVMFDEPTSGMDVSARRFTWDLLQREREGRTILLTTHFMDEADVLGDRIAIMADGEIKCCGSSLFLKNKYGVGYHMVMVKDSDNCDTEAITSLVQSHVPIAQLESNNIGTELSYILPSEYSCKFQGLFMDIEDKQKDLGISSYGASVTTLEEVFFKVGEASGNNEMLDEDLPTAMVNPVVNESEGNSSMNNVDFASFNNGVYQKNKGFRLAFQRWNAMLVKKMLFSKRHKSSIISQLIMPSIFVVIALLAVKMMPMAILSPPRELVLDMFGKSFVAFKSYGNSTFTKRFRDAYSHKAMETSTFEALSSHHNLTEYFLHREAIDLPKFNLEYVVALDVSFNDPSDPNNVSAIAWFNNEAIHTAPVSLNLLTNTLLALYTNNSKNKIVATNHPLPVTSQQGFNDITMNPVGFQVGFALCFGMSFLASSFIVALVQERASKAKHLQFVSGVDPLSYWTSSFLWDLITFLLPCLSIYVIFRVFDDECFSGERIGYLMLLFFSFGWAVIPLMYVFSFTFRIASTAYTRMTIMNVGTSVLMVTIISVLNIPRLNLLETAHATKWAFMLFPTFCVGQGVIDLFNNFQGLKIFNHAIETCLRVGREIKVYPSREVCTMLVRNKFAEQKRMLLFQDNYLAWSNPGIGRYLVFLAAEGVVFLSVVLLIEYKVFRKIVNLFSFSSNMIEDTSYTQPSFTCDDKAVCSPAKKVTPGGDSGDIEEEDASNLPQVNFLKNKVRFVKKEVKTLDDDVIREKERINNREGRANEVLVFRDLTKIYNPGSGDPLVAVNKLSLGIPHGECFGLLGQNGAGKTTTFKMLTGDETITSGSAYVDSIDISTNLSKVLQRVGYCPQFDALIDLMTGRELLTMYARLRGVPENQISNVINVLAKNLTFDKYMDRVTKTYSGGNKRKLSTALALVGDPPLVFLDEPSSGMDPIARRMLWDYLSKVISSGKSIVITSHSMEECEALCTRIAIMVNGQFKCLGSSQHLKNKFGEGYTLIARVGGINQNTDALREFIENTFPGSVLKDIHQGYVHYQLITEKHWPDLFGVMEEVKNELNIEDYSLSQTTLEQIFLNFTRSQRIVDD